MNARSLIAALALSVSVLSAPMAYAAPTPTPTAQKATPAATATAKPAATVTSTATPTPMKAVATPKAAATPNVTATPAPIPAHPVDQKYAAIGGAANLGEPVGDAVRCGLRNGGCYRFYANGGIYWTQATGAQVVRGAILQLWAGQGWEAGRLGYPTSDEKCTSAGCLQTFTGGQVHWTPKSGAVTVTDPLLPAYRYETLGLVTGPAACGLKDGGCWQPFEKGALYWSSKSGAHANGGAIRALWGQTGWEGGFLGYPTSNEECRLAGGGCFQRFQGGMIYWTADTGAHWIRGAIFDEWGRSGWEVGRLGYPTSNEICGLARGGCLQNFQRGHIYWSPATGAKPVFGAIFDHWGRNRWEAGHLGYPISGEFCGLRAGGCGQHFQGGSIYWSPTTGAHFVKGLIKEEWAKWGWEAQFGYPLTDEICGMKNGGCRQVFEGNDHIYYSPAAGTSVVYAELMGKWGEFGWENGRLGYPVSPYWDESSGRVEHGVEFQGGYLYFYEGDTRTVHVFWK